MTEMSLTDIAVSFDTTGSMYPCITEVRRKLTDMVDELFSRIPGLRMSIIAHGDYCDDGSPYIISTLDFTSDKRGIVNFINNVKNTGGGDSDECYELVLNKARSLNWQSGRSKALVVIGDANPHEVGYRYGSHRNSLDWRNESRLLAEMGVQIYSCHAMASIRSSSYHFYTSLAEIGKGYYVTLAQFSSLPTLLMGIAYNQNSPEQFMEFAKQVESNNRMTRDLYTSFTAMGATSLSPIAPSTSRTYVHKPSSLGMSSMKDVPAELTPVPASRFQVFTIDTKQDIRSFINNQHVMFKPGRGFYQLSKSVKVQQHKEIILVDKKTGDMFTGAPVRKLLGLLPQTTSGGTTQRLSSHDLPKDFNVFIQSTSYNRELLPGTLFMYEMDDWDKDVETRTVFPDLPKAERVTGTTTGRTSSTRPTPTGKPATTATGRIPTEPEMAEMPKKHKTTPPKNAMIVDMDFSAIEARVAGMITRKEASAYFMDIVVPEKLLVGMKAFLLKTAQPTMSWNAVSDKLGRGSGSGLRKAAQRFADWMSATRKEVEKKKAEEKKALRAAAKVPSFTTPAGFDKLKFMPVPEKLRESKVVYMYKASHPEATWEAIAKKFYFSTGSGARKCAQRYAKWLEEKHPVIKTALVDEGAVVPTKSEKTFRSIEKARSAFDYRVANPEVSWVQVAAHTGFDSGSGARKAAKRYEEYISKE